MFRELKANEIECRVGTINEKGLSLLLYKDARCDMNILDESNVKWQRKHLEHKGVMYCSVGIYDTDIGEWVWREDAGSESYTEKEKGEASDSFKRACVNWGIGRALYTSPFIWIPAKDCNIKAGKNGKPVCYDKFIVQIYEVENGEIVKLAIVNTATKNVVFRHGI